jgi:hypothetical protein
VFQPVGNLQVVRSVHFIALDTAFALQVVEPLLYELRGVVIIRIEKARQHSRGGTSAEAAEEAGLSDNKWILNVIQERLAIRNAESRKREDIAALDRKIDMKWEEMIAVLAAKQGLGDLASLAAKDRLTLEEEVDRALVNWDNEAHDKKPKSDLDRLCKEYNDLNDEIDRVRNKGYDTDPTLSDMDLDEGEDYFDDDYDNGS